MFWINDVQQNFLMLNKPMLANVLNQLLIMNKVDLIWHIRQFVSQNRLEGEELNDWMKQLFTKYYFYRVFKAY